MIQRDVSAEPSWLRLQADVAWGRCLLAVATTRDRADVRPEIFLFLGDRYWRLARRHFLAGRQCRAQRLVRLARLYFRSGGGAAPPPLGAAAMPVPQPPTFVAALAGAGVSGGDDAA